MQHKLNTTFEVIQVEKKYLHIILSKEDIEYALKKRAQEYINHSTGYTFTITDEDIVFNTKTDVVELDNCTLKLELR
jgi:hypothetical protein